jgi:hypothetical protein
MPEPAPVIRMDWGVMTGFPCDRGGLWVAAWVHVAVW